MTGIGVDIIEIERFQHSITRFGNRLLKKIFTDDEILFCAAQPDPAGHFASFFAAKEALSKALATGNSGDFEWKNVEVKHQPMKNPYFIFYNKTAARLKESTVHLSISHSDIQIVAFVIIENNFV